MVWKIMMLSIGIWIGCMEAKAAEEEIKIAENMVVIPLSGHAYMYVATDYIEGFGQVPSNGLILKEGNQAFLLDTPLSDAQTQILSEWIEKSLHARLVGFVPNHWHRDCMGGLGYLHRMGVKSYANQMTIDEARKNNLPVPQRGFTDSLALKLGEMDLLCYYLGGGHAADNIVVWIPSEKILFGGCLVKDSQAKNLGNTSDAVLEEWPVTIERVYQKFPEARMIIPGHGDWGGRELLTHTLELLKVNP